MEPVSWISENVDRCVLPSITKKGKVKSVLSLEYKNFNLFEKEEINVTKKLKTNWKIESTLSKLR